MKAFKKLLKYHMDKDEDVFVKVGNATIPVKLGVIESMLPVMKTALENSLQEENRDDKVVFINDFELSTVQLFFFLLNEDSWPQYDWKSLVELVKFAHFYQATNVLNEIVKHSQCLVNIDNIYEVIEMIELFELTGWNARILEIFQKHIKSILKNVKYEHLINGCPKTMVQLLYCMHKSWLSIEIPNHFCSNDNSNISNIRNIKEVIMQYYLNQDSTVTVTYPNNSSDPFIIPVSVIHCLLPVIDKMVSVDANNVVLKSDFEDMHMKLFFDILTRNKFPEDISWDNVMCMIKIGYFFQLNEFLDNFFVNGGKMMNNVYNPNPNPPVAVAPSSRFATGQSSLFSFCISLPHIDKEVSPQKRSQIFEAIEGACIYGVNCESVDFWYEDIHNKICYYNTQYRDKFHDQRWDEYG